MNWQSRGSVDSERLCIARCAACLDRASDDLGLNAALISAAGNLEVAVVTPVLRGAQRGARVWSLQGLPHASSATRTVFQEFSTSQYAWPFSTPQP